VNRGTYRLRRLAVLALGAITVVSGIGVLGAGTAGASPTPPQATSVTTGIAASSEPTIFPGVADQPAGNWTFTLNNTYANLDTIIINLPQCVSATNFVGFAATPGVSVVPASPTTETTPTFVVTLAQQTTPPAAVGCTVGNVKDELRITLTNDSSAGTTNWDVTVSGVTYTVGSATPAGAVPTNTPPSGAFYVSSSGTPTPTSVGGIEPNAIVGDVQITANNPPVVVQPSSTNQAISNVVVKEFATGSLPTGTVEVTLQNGGAFSAGSTPVVTITPAGTGATAGAVTGMGGNQLSFDVTQSTLAPATYTLSGLSVDASANSGPQFVDVFDSGPDTEFGTVQAFSIIGASRIQGQVATDTSANLFQSNGCNSTAVLATSDNYPDALSAAYLASRNNYNTSVIITPTAAVATATLNALRLEGVQTVLVVGGPLAISPADIATLQSTPSYFCGGLTVRTHIGNPQMLAVQQIFGQDQYGTAQAVAQFAATANLGSIQVPGAYGGTYNDTTGADGTPAALAPSTAVTTAIVATGVNFPDAMAASATSWNEGLPILLTPKDSLATEASGAIINLGIQQVIVMGGPDAISDNVLTQLEALGVTVFRIAGIDMTDTAQLLGHFELNRTAAPGFTVRDGLGWSMFANNAGLTVTRGDNWQDALSASSFAGRNRSPLLVTFDPNTVGTFLTSFLNAAGSAAGVGTGHSSPQVFSQLTLLGGPFAISLATQATLVNDLAT
jgi:putative cell wall-binding protein